MASIVLNENDIASIGNFSIYAVSYRFTKDAYMQYIIDEELVKYESITYPLIWYSKLPKRAEDCIAGETCGDAYYSELTSLFGWVKLYSSETLCSDWFGLGVYSSIYVKNNGIVTNGTKPSNTSIPPTLGINQNNQIILGIDNKYTNTYALGFPNTTEIIQKQLDTPKESIMNVVLKPSNYKT